MKLITYFSGLMSAFLFSGWLITLILGHPRHYLFLLASLAIFLLVHLPIKIHMQKKHKERMAQIIRDYKNRENSGPVHENNISASKGWNMNNSPFRSRKSGLRWGSGNIHAARGSRGTRKKFLDK